MRQVLRVGVVLFAAALLFAVAGCTKKPSPVVVAGKVEFAGARPNAPLVLNFHPLDDANRTCTPSAAVEADGAFKLSACLPGRYKATLAPLPISEGGKLNGAPGVVRPGGRDVSGVPRAYLDVTSSPWDVTVPETGKDGLVLTVSAP